MTRPESIPFLDSVELGLARVFEVYLPAIIFPFLLHRYLQNHATSRDAYAKMRQKNKPGS